MAVKDIYYEWLFIPTHALIYILKHQFILILKTLKNSLKHFGEVVPTCFGLPIRPSSGGAHAVLCAVTRLEPADVRSLIVCVVCGRMPLPSVCMYVLRSCPGEVWSWTRSDHGPGLVMDQVWSWARSGHGPGLVMDQVWSWTRSGHTRSGHGPGLVMDQVWSWTKSGHGPGLVIDQVWSWTRSGHGPGLVMDHTSPGQELKTYIQTDGNGIQPHTTQTINERTSAGSNLVTVQSMACAPPEDGRIGRPKHVGATSPKCF